MDVVKQLPPEAEAARSGGPLPTLLRIVRGPYALRGWAIVSLVMNIVIVVTGGLVRLTGSGLGCPTWPRCTEDSYVSHPELGIHGAIEFGNRLFTLVLVLAAALTFISAMLYRENGRPRTDLRWLAAGLALGIPLQGIIGGITVLTQLNPYVVGLHLLLSMVLIALAVWLVRKTWHLAPAHASGLSVAATRVTFVLMWLAIWSPAAGRTPATRTHRGTASTRCSSRACTPAWSTRPSPRACSASCCCAAGPCCCYSWSRSCRRESAWPNTSWDYRFGWWRSTCSALRWPLRRPPT